MCSLPAVQLPQLATNLAPKFSVVRDVAGDVAGNISYTAADLKTAPEIQCVATGTIDVGLANSNGCPF
jgi:hypothetical protein